MSKFKELFALGAIIIIAGLILQWYPESTIAGLEYRLSSSGLSAEQRTELQGVLLSWGLWQIVVFNPISTILLAAGIITIIYAILSEIFSLTSKFIETQK